MSRAEISTTEVEQLQMLVAALADKGYHVREVSLRTGVGGQPSQTRITLVIENQEAVILGSLAEAAGLTDSLRPR